MNDLQRKTLMTVILVLCGCILAILAVPTPETHSASGIIVDYGDYDIDYSRCAAGVNAANALDGYASDKSYTIVWNAEHSAPVTINSLPAEGSTTSWHLFVTKSGSKEWTLYEGNPADVNPINYSAVSWGLVEDGKKPTPGVDATGVCYYGYGQKYNLVSLAPSCTETICAVGNGHAIIGCDRYSNYPSYIAEGLANGTISSVGGYTDPSYEVVAQLGADMIIGISSQNAHRSIIEKMRANGTDCVMTYDGESLDTIYVNTYMVGVALGYDMKAKQVNAEISSALATLTTTMLDSGKVKDDVKVALTLSTAKSPWVAGGNTYASDVITYTFSINCFSSVKGWQQVSSEMIPTYNPDFIIVVSSDIANTDAAYYNMLDNLSAEWKNTSAYNNGHIILLTESATDLASRPSTRVAQFTELMCRTIQIDCFDDGITVPKHIGNDYADYLYYTKSLGYDT